MIVVTGAAGFIASCLIKDLNTKGFSDIIAVDDFSKTQRLFYLNDLEVKFKVDRGSFFTWVTEFIDQVDFVFHLGARTDTLEGSTDIFNRLNLDYSKRMWKLCVKHDIPIIYASSAATYGNGENGYSDDHQLVSSLRPLNEYAISKHSFDLWALEQPKSPPYWAGLKFFNVFGPNESHKGKMASMVLQAYQQIKKTGQVKLFKSYRTEFEDGEQKRDFIYVKDVTRFCLELMSTRQPTGLINVGRGIANSFNSLVRAVFAATGVQEKIEYIDMPAELEPKYQYWTEADLSKTKPLGFLTDSLSLSEAIHDYVANYLEHGHSY